MNLNFKYHRDPIKTGSIVASESPCICCGGKRGYIYKGPVYAIEELHEQICPWCIADGSAAKKYDAEFSDAAGIGGGLWCEVSPEVIDEVARRTPGFPGWQQAQWWSHCDDAGQFLGSPKGKDIEALGPQFLEELKMASGMDDANWPHYWQGLLAGNATAYLFRCRHCGQLGGYSDCS